MRAVFYDTWAFAALANAADPAHGRAAEADRAVEERGLVAVTSDYVLDEALTLAQARAGAAVSLALLDVLVQQIDGEVLMLVEITRARRDRAVRLFRKLAPDTPRLSFTDCTSMAVMNELGIEVAFTADAHFHEGAARMRPLFEHTRSGLRWQLPG